MSDRIQGLSIGLGLDDANVAPSLSSIRREMRALNSEAKTTSNNFKHGKRDTEAYKKSIDQLTDTTDKQRRNVEELGRKYAETVEEQGASSKAAQDLANEYNKQADNLNRLENELSGMKSELEQLTEEQRIAESQWTKTGEAMDRFGDKAQKVGGGMKDVGKKMTLGITAPLLAFAGLSVKTGMDFDDAMSQVAAISGATGDDLLALREKAKEMGETTKFSASEAAEGLNFMALAGWSTEDMLDGLDGVMSLAAASGEDLGAVSDIVTDSLSAFGLEAKDSGQFADVLAAAAANANTDVKGLGAAFQYVAPVAGAMGFTVEDTAKAIGLMSDNGIKGEKAGTALRTMMTNLASPTKAMKEEMDNLGISLTNADGSMKTFDEIMQDLRSSFDGLSEEQQASAAATIFGKEAMSGALSIINTTEDSFDNLGNAINNSEGAAATMADTMENNLGGTWREIKSGLEGLSISIYEMLLPAIQAMSDKILEGIQWINGLSPQMKGLGLVIAGVAAAIGPLLVVGGTMLIWIGSIAKTLAPVMTSIAKAGGLVKWLTPLFTKLGSVIAVMTGPVGLTVAAIVGLGAAFVVAYNQSETFRNFISGLRERFVGAWQSAMTFKDNIVTAFQSIFSFFQGDTEGGIDLLQSIGLSDEVIEKIYNAVATIQRNFYILRGYIMTALNAVAVFVQEKIAQIIGFWQTDGQQILQAVRNIFTGISTAISTAINFAVPIIRGGLNIILSIFQFVWPAVLFVVQMVWSNIKGVIDGGLRFIQGLVQVFSGIFTGDFSKMWEGVKNIFSGAIQFVWNLFQLMFWGRIIKGITAFIRGGISLFRNFGSQTGSVFTSMWQSVVRIFTNLWQGGVRIFNNMRTSLTNTVQNINSRINSIISRLVSAVLNFFRNLLSRGVQIFNNLRTSLTTTVGNIRSGITTRISDLVSSVVRFFQNLLSRGREIFTNLRTSIVDRISRMRQGVVDGVTRMRDRALEIYRNLKDKAAEFLTDMVDGAKKLPGRIGDGIKNMASKAVDGIKSLGNSMVGKLGEVVNGVIKGINNITGKLGITATIDKWDVPTFSTGTAGGGSLVSNGRIAQDTLATVGDRGPGNGSGTRELVQYPNGTAGLYDNDATIFAPRGTVIWNNRQTEEILAKNPQFSRGTVGGSGTDKEQKKDKKKGLLGTIGDVLSNTWDYITNPGKALQAVIDNVAPDFSGLKGFAGTIVKGSFNFIKDKALDWLTGIFKDNEGGNVDGSSILGKKILQTFGRYTGGISFNGGKHYGIDTAHKFDPLISPTDGKVTRVWNDYGGGKSLQITSDKYIWWFMHLSKIMKQVGDMVKAGMRVGTTGSSGNFVVGSGHLHTQVHPKSKGASNSTAIDPLPILKGLNSHRLGGMALSDGLVNVHKGEYLINPNHPTEAMKLIALAGKQVAAKSKQTRELPNPGGYGDSRAVEVLLEIAENQQRQINQNQQQISQMTQAMKILMGIEQKTGISQRDIVDAYDQNDYHERSLRMIKQGRKQGGPGYV